MNKLMLLPLMLLPLSGCGGDDTPTPPAPPPAQAATCSAKIGHGASNYTLDQRTLTLASGSSSIVLTRDPTSTSTSVFGVWDLPQTPGTAGGLLTVTGQFDIEATSVTSVASCSFAGRHGMATATGRATIDQQALTITVLEDAQQSNDF
jgi:hypothetical protein